MKAKERNPNHLEHDNIDEGASGKSLQDRSHLVMMTIMMILSKKMIMMVTQHIPTMTKSHHGGEMSVMIKVVMCHFHHT